MSEPGKYKRLGDFPKRPGEDLLAHSGTLLAFCISAPPHSATSHNRTTSSVTQACTGRSASQPRLTQPPLKNRSPRGGGT